MIISRQWSPLLFAPFSAPMLPLQPPHRCRVTSTQIAVSHLRNSPITEVNSYTIVTISEMDPIDQAKTTVCSIPSYILLYIKQLSAHKRDVLSTY